MSFLEQQYQEYLYPESMYYKHEDAQPQSVYGGPQIPMQSYKQNLPGRARIGQGNSGRNNISVNQPRPGMTNSNRLMDRSTSRAGQNNNQGDNQGDSHIKIEILILNKSSKLNKKLFKFFTTDLDYLNKKGFKFEWIIVYEDEMDIYEEQNIVDFPCMISANRRTAGVTQIINALRGNAKSGKTKSDDDGGLNSYFHQEINSKEEDDEMDEADMFSQSLTARLSAMQRARNLNGQPTTKLSDQEVHERTGRNAIKKNKYQHRPQQAQRGPRGDNLEERRIEETPSKDVPSAAEIARATARPNNPDDELLAKFWENMTETEMD
jgi:hypothetical protein